MVEARASPGPLPLLPAVLHYFCNALTQVLQRTVGISMSLPGGRGQGFVLGRPVRPQWQLDGATVAFTPVYPDQLL
jgi:hypothetical protein